MHSQEGEYNKAFGRHFEKNPNPDFGDFNWSPPHHGVALFGEKKKNLEGN